ncbi:MAG: hypothetical protein H6Q73_1010 [Firmicutes bacterium]|nr:hypothetical protein [Bacillota bacterium]
MATRVSDSGSLIQVQAQRRENTEKERINRQLREQKKNEEIEAALAALSVFDYKPVEYETELIRKEFSEPQIPDFSYLLSEARDKVVKGYQSTFLIQGALGMVFALLCLVVWNYFVVIVGVAGVIACAISMNRDIKSKQDSIERALRAAKENADQKVKEIKDSIDGLRKVFIETENARIEKLKLFLNGDRDSVLAYMENVLQEFRLPFFLKCTIYYQQYEPVLEMRFPEQSIIPPNNLTLSANGDVVSEEKSPFEINRQYSEVLAATAVSVALKLYSAVPTLECLYVQGIVDNSGKEVYVFSMKTTRQLAIEEAVKCKSGMEACQVFEAEYSVKTAGSLAPIQPVFPGWWDMMPKDKIKSVTVSCLQR